jgi:hypothetical protein
LLLQPPLGPGDLPILIAARIGVPVTPGIEDQVRRSTGAPDFF